jgi:hypothetical protein
VLVVVRAVGVLVAPQRSAFYSTDFWRLLREKCAFCSGLVTRREVG